MEQTSTGSTLGTPVPCLGPSHHPYHRPSSRSMFAQRDISEPVTTDISVDRLIHQQATIAVLHRLPASCRRIASAQRLNVNARRWPLEVCADPSSHSSSRLCRISSGCWGESLKRSLVDRVAGRHSSMGARRLKLSPLRG